MNCLGSPKTAMPMNSPTLAGAKNIAPFLMIDLTPAALARGVAKGVPLAYQVEKFKAAYPVVAPMKTVAHPPIAFH
jgi:hypothetical protein